MCWTLRCVLYTGYAAWQIKRIRTYIRRGMVYSRPLRGRRIPTAAQTKTYIAYTYLALAFSFQPYVCSFSPLSPLPVPFHPYHSTFYSTLFAGETWLHIVSLLCLSVSLCYAVSIRLCFFLYIDIIFN